ncbi:hypothetical protein CMI37_09190 [Candidatus Pacearchaeota archaeon]|nr:hypothetical protein [Candidatus Pacearchaeota archaeon]|tara:strand:+ start:2850 stop:3056 length:207 start_codon:yes stop_codon:yes gene_type:complete
MAEKKENTPKANNKYKATAEYKTFRTNEGGLKKEQHEKLLKGESVDLKDAPDAEMQHLIANNLINKGE